MTALVTGMVDAVECVLLDTGLDPAELTGPSGGGRVQMFVDNGSSQPGWGSLTDLATELSQYDSVLLPCDGIVPSGPSPVLGPVVDYLNGGGRLYTSHFEFLLFDLPTCLE